MDKKNKPSRFLEHGKLPPQAIDLEEAVLGAIMLEKDAILEVIDVLSSKSFYKESHQMIFSAVIDLNNDSSPIDILTVTQKLKSKGELELVGGAYFITQLTNRVSSAANIEYHARIIMQKFIQREVIRVSSEAITDSFDETTDAFELTEKLLTDIYNINGNSNETVKESNTVVLRRLRKEIEQAKTLQGLTGLPSGIQALDRITGGYQKSDLIIKAGRPGMGKSSQALCEANFMANKMGKKILFFSLEMSHIQLMRKLVAVNSDIPLNKMKDGNMSSDDWNVYNNAVSEMMTDNLTIDDTPGISLTNLRKKAKKRAIKHGLDGIYIDYLQLMTHNVGNGNAEQEINLISRGLKGLAKELNIPVIALSQLSRAVEARGGAKKPQLSDLRGSGAIEQDADIVQFLYRPEYYGMLEDDDGNSTLNKGYLIIAKNRNGSLKDVPMKFIDYLTKFSDWETERPNIEAEVYRASAGIDRNEDFDKEDPF